MKHSHENVLHNIRIRRFEKSLRVRFAMRTTFINRKHLSFSFKDEFFFLQIMNIDFS